MLQRLEWECSAHSYMCASRLLLSRCCTHTTLYTEIALHTQPPLDWKGRCQPLLIIFNHRTSTAQHLLNSQVNALCLYAPCPVATRKCMQSKKNLRFHGGLAYAARPHAEASATTQTPCVPHPVIQKAFQTQHSVFCFQRQLWLIPHC
jgi:hypothetical protein